MGVVFNPGDKVRFKDDVDLFVQDLEHGGGMPAWEELARCDELEVDTVYRDNLIIRVLPNVAVTGTAGVETGNRWRVGFDALEFIEEVEWE